MRYLELLGGAAALALISASAHAQPAPSTPPTPAPATTTPDCQAGDTKCQNTNAPTTDQAAPSTPSTTTTDTTTATPPPAETPAPTPQATATAAPIPGATETAQLSAQSTPDQPSRLYVMNTTNASGAQVQIVTNGPVPDTRENRRMYRPLSRAGRRSRPEGN